MRAPVSLDMQMKRMTGWAVASCAVAIMSLTLPETAEARRGRGRGGDRVEVRDRDRDRVDRFTVNFFPGRRNADRRDIRLARLDNRLSVPRGLRAEAQASGFFDDDARRDRDRDRDAR